MPKDMPKISNFALAMIYPKNFESKIGFATVRSEIERRCISSLGVSQCSDMRFSLRRDEVISWLTQTNEFLSIITSGKEFPLDHYFDVRQALKSIAAPGTYISEENLFHVQRSLFTMSDIVKFFAVDEGEKSPYPALAELVSAMRSFPDILSQIGNILDKFGNVKDTASPELHDLRRALASTTASINGILRNVISQGRQAGYLDKDVTPSVRDGRLVLPVSPMNKRKIKGIVHDESATGKTIFIEPAEIVEANNNIRELESDIHREIVRILTVISDNIRPHIPDMLDSYAVMGKIDFIRAKALFAQAIDASMPHIEKRPHVELYHAVHPGLYLSLKEQGKEVVPLNITLDKKDRILLISGPNAGGKSVCLKTVGIVQYMTQCGVLPPVYYNSHIGIFRNLFIDIGDQQSIEDDLSTYSSHLTNMKTFLNRGDESTLVLIDEFGGGTEPQIGGAIAQAILDRLNQKKIFGVITTHYQNLKHFADDTEGIINGAMLYDRQHMQPLFQLSIGYPGSSFAIEIARKIGLPREVVDEASEIVGSDYINFDKYLLDIARDRKYWESKRTEIHAKERRIDMLLEQYNEQVANISKEHKEIIRSAKREAKDILAQSNANIERTIREIKEAQAEKEKTKEIRRQLDDFKRRIASDGAESKSAGNLPKPIKGKKAKAQGQSTTSKEVDAPLMVGDNVMLEGSNTVGSIIAIEGKQATVAFGDLRTRVDLKRLKRTMRQVEKKTVGTLTTSTTNEIREKQLHFNREIDVRGMRADEAIQAVTYFIDDAIQFSAGEVRILHGTGNGILRMRIREYLNAVREVRSYHDEHVQFGGAGITVVELK